MRTVFSIAPILPPGRIQQSRQSQLPAGRGPGPESVASRENPSLWRYHCPARTVAIEIKLVAQTRPVAVSLTGPKFRERLTASWTHKQFWDGRTISSLNCVRESLRRNLSPQNGEVEILTNPEAPAPPKRAPVGQPIGFRAKNGTTPAYPLRGDTTHAQRGFFSDSVCRVSLDAVHRWRTGRCLDGHARFHRLTTRIARLLCCQHSLRVQ